MFLLVNWLYYLMPLVYDEREHINHFMYSSCNNQNYNIYRKKIININKSHQCWWDLIPSVVLNWQKQSGALDTYLYYEAIWTKISAWRENLTSSISICHQYTMNPITIGYINLFSYQCKMACMHVFWCAGKKIVIKIAITLLIWSVHLPKSSLPECVLHLIIECMLSLL